MLPSVALLCRICRKIACTVSLPVMHSIRSIMTEDSRLFKYFPIEMHVNSAHHQRIDRLGQHLKIIQRCPDDGCPEALEHDELPILGLQWHPERLPDWPVSLCFLFFLLISESCARAFSPGPDPL